MRSEREGRRDAGDHAIADAIAYMLGLVYACAIAACVTPACRAAPRPAPAPTPDLCADKRERKQAPSAEELTRRCAAGGDLTCVYGARLAGTVVSVVDCSTGRRLVVAALPESELQGRVTIVTTRDESGPPLAGAAPGDTVRVIVNDYPVLKKDNTLLDPTVPHSISRDR